MTVCRPPTDVELATAERLVAESPSPQEWYEDLLWALVNSKAFLFVR